MLSHHMKKYAPPQREHNQIRILTHVHHHLAHKHRIKFPVMLVPPSALPLVYTRFPLMQPLQMTPQEDAQQGGTGRLRKRDATSTDQLISLIPPFFPPTSPTADGRGPTAPQGLTAHSGGSTHHTNGRAPLFPLPLPLHTHTGRSHCPAQIP